MNTVAAKTPGEVSALCPYCDEKAWLCRASISLMRLERMIGKGRCAAESYEECALFLSKILRRG
jgi:hypothetical protein